MKISDYINYIINNPTNFMFVINKVGDEFVYIIFYKDDITGHTRMIWKFKTQKNFCVDSCTELIIANKDEIKLEQFYKLATKAK